MPNPSQLNNTRRAASTVPGAGVEATITVPTGKAWQLFAVTVALVQGATQTPQPILVIDDGANTIFEMYGASAAQAVSTTCQYSWAPDVPLTAIIGATTNCHATGPLPIGLTVPGGYRIRTNTIGIGANSAYGAMGLFIVEFG